jgi:hypothetical protein
MAEVTISPIPYNGGTILTGDRNHFCRLSGNRFFAVYGQRTPDLTFGMVFDVDGINTATPTTTVVRAQVLSEITTTYGSVSYRVCRLNDTDVLVMQETSPLTLSLHVYRYDSNTNVISKVGNSLIITRANSNSQVVSSPFGATAAVNVADNIAIFGARHETNVHQMYVRRVVFDPATSTLTSSVNSPVVQTAASSSYDFGFMTLSRGRMGSTLFAASVGFQSSTPNWTATDTQFVMQGDPVAGTAFSAAAPWVIYSTLPFYLPIDSTQGLAITSSRSWRHVNNGVLAPSDTIFCPTAVANAYNRVVNAQWLDQDTIILATNVNTTSNNTNWNTFMAGGRYYRIVKYTDPYFAETSPATTPNLLLFNSNFTDDYGIGQSFEKHSNNTFLQYGRNGNNFALRVLYVP